MSQSKLVRQQPPETKHCFVSYEEGVGRSDLTTVAVAVVDDVDLAVLVSLVDKVLKLGLDQVDSLQHRLALGMRQTFDDLATVDMDTHVANGGENLGPARR